MQHRFRFALLAACLAAVAAVAADTGGAPDEILLRSGAVIRGRVMDDTGSGVKVEIPVTTRGANENPPPIVVSIDKKGIRAITRGGDGFFQSSEWVDTRPAVVSRPTPSPLPGDFDSIFARPEEVDGNSWDLPLAEETWLSDMERRLASDAFRRLGSPNASERQTALAQLSAMGDRLWRVAVEVFRVDPVVLRRVTAADLLGEMKEKRATAALAASLDAQDVPAEVQTAAWRALIALTGETLPYDPTADANTRAIQADAWRTLVGAPIASRPSVPERPSQPAEMPEPTPESEPEPSEPESEPEVVEPESEPEAETTDGWGDFERDE